MKYVSLFLIITFGSVTGMGQEMDYNILSTFNKPVEMQQLMLAKTMSDINADYPSSWIDAADYVSSEVKVIDQGNVLVATGENDNLTFEQKAILQKADVGTNIEVEVKYKSLNSITQNRDLKTMNFTLSLMPHKEAEFPGGKKEMLTYIKENVMDKISEKGMSVFEMAKVRFKVNADGKISDSVIVNSSKNREVDHLLLDFIAQMPNWKEAQTAEGVKVTQEFDLVIGTMIGC